MSVSLNVFKYGLFCFVLSFCFATYEVYAGCSLHRSSPVDRSGRCLHPEHRCSTSNKNCLCRVTSTSNGVKTPRNKGCVQMSDAPTGDLKNKCDSRKGSLSIYFDEGKSNLESNDINDLSRYINNNPRTSAYHLEGFTDSCGSASLNAKLGASRVSSVLSYISRYYSANSKPRRFTALNYSESHSDSHHDTHKRVDLYPVDSLSQLMDIKPTDFYLIDQSGSMSKYWKEIQDYKFPTKARSRSYSTSNVYLSSAMGASCRYGDNIKNVSSAGGTEIWYSFYNMIDKMRPGQSVTLISDFDSNVPLTSGEWGVIKAKLISKGIRLEDVHFIQIKGRPILQRLHQ